MTKDAVNLLKLICNKDCNINDGDELYNMYNKRYKNITKDDWNTLIKELDDELLLVVDDNNEIVAPRPLAYVELKRYKENHSNTIKGIIVDTVEESIKFALSNII